MTGHDSSGTRASAVASRAAPGCQTPICRLLPAGRATVHPG